MKLICQVLSICGWIFHAFITYRLGFQKFYSRGEQQLLSFWGASTDSHFHNKAPVGYYYRPGSNPEKQSPIVFVHGIGVGLLCYLSFFKQLVMESDRPVVAIELPHVSSLLYPIYRPVVEDVPTVAEMVDAVEHIFRKHGFVRSTRQGGKGQLNKATFIGHSLGTTVLAWIIRHRPHLVQKAIFIDPICFMLHVRFIILSLRTIFKSPFIYSYCPSFRHTVFHSSILPFLSSCRLSYMHTAFSSCCLFFMLPFIYSYCPSFLHTELVA